MTMGIEAPPVHLAAAPLSHAAGALAMAMLPGATTNVVLRNADQLAIMKAIEKHRVTHLYLPPTLLYLLLAHEDVRNFDYSSLTHFSLAAAPVAPEKLREALDVFGPVMCQSYGQTEVPQIATFLSTRDLLQARCRAAESNSDASLFSSCGRATPAMRVEIMDDDGNILPPGSRGEIVMKGGMVFPGYYNNAKQTEETFRFGWHHTGDIGYMDENGYFYIVDRKKDVIISGGFNVFSVEVEAVILSCPAVRDCAVIGVPDPKWGEAVKAVIELKAGESVTAEEIMQLVRTKLGAVHSPKTVEFCEELPRHPNGKVLKRVIRDKYWQERDRMVG
jgi:acyl-CoA synthetase (AMP-forming)/AMP-acid ligase II